MKAILILDMPDNANIETMKKTPVSLSFDFGNYKSLMCVEGYLRPMPEKRKYSEELADTDGEDMYMRGWNDCIDEILGETEWERL